MATANSDTIKTALGDTSLKTVSSDKFGEVGYIMLNVAQGPNDPNGDNAKSPLLLLPCRQALAAAIDRDRVAKERGGGIVAPADGPFPPGSKGYLPDSGYPKFDVAQAQKYMDACLAATGTKDINFTFNTTNDPFNVETNQLIISMWQDAFSDAVKTNITPTEQGQYIGLALNGTFQAFAWRNHSGVDPDQQRTWWASAAAKPIGTTAVNFGRFQDPIIDKALDTIKTNGDPAARKAAAEDINREFGAQVWNLWLTRSDSAIIMQPYVNGINSNKLPDGTNGIGLYGQQRHQISQIWCDNGKCE
jgi:peptide/nickel transport system substrate-binding protein